MTAPDVVREDLSDRSPLLLSKSALSTFDLCQHRSFFGIHDPRPYVINEDMAFGSAVDAAVEKVGEALRSGQTIDMARALAAAEYTAERDGIAVDLDEVEVAIVAFVAQVAPKFDWSYAAFQKSLRMTVDGLGECDGHPDVILGSGVYDVKTSKRAKPMDAAATSVELAFYGLLIEEYTGEKVGKVGYLTYVRTSKPYWQVLETDYTDEMRRWVREVALAYVRARNADAVLNGRALKEGKPATNWTFGGRPKFAALCDSCQYAPANGGACPIALRPQEVEGMAA